MNITSEFFAAPSRYCCAAVSFISDGNALSVAKTAISIFQTFLDAAILKTKTLAVFRLIPLPTFAESGRLNRAVFFLFAKVFYLK
jgi:hypothetical protein